MRRRALRRVLLGRDVLALVAFLVLPVAAGAVETALVSPLALPGYLLLTVGSAYGSHLFPRYALWLFWLPFLGGSYGLAVCLAGAWRFVRDRRGDG